MNLLRRLLRLDRPPPLDETPELDERLDEARDLTGRAERRLELLEARVAVLKGRRT